MGRRWREVRKKCDREKREKGGGAVTRARGESVRQ